jgi:two-component system heavy metal sensor histidine kinase CusS
MICMGALGIFSYSYLRYALASSRQLTMQKREGRLLRFVEENLRSEPNTPLSESLFRFSLASPDADLLQAYSTKGVQLYPQSKDQTSLLPIQWADTDCQTPCFGIVNISGHSYRVLHHLVTINGQTIRLTMAGAIDEHYDILRTVRNSYFIFFPLMLAASIIGGLALGGRALRPVDRITRAAHTISIRDLRRRLPVPNTGDEIQRLAETWNDVLTRLDGAVERLSQFTSDISHDLRTSITVMLATAELTLRRERTGDEYREALKTVVLECQATTVLLDDLLAASRADMAGQNIELSPVNLSAIVRQACHHLGSSIELKQLVLEASLQADIWILGDHSMLRRLAMILLDNAVKYTSEGGTIRVSVSGKLNRASLEVQDSGVGIASEEINKVFHRFYRSDTSRNRDQGGTGLGLAIAKWIVECHGGEISLTSNINVGSAFTVHFDEVADRPGMRANGMNFSSSLPMLQD